MRARALVARAARTGVASAACVALGATVVGAQAPGERVRIHVVPPAEEPYPRTVLKGAFVRMGADSVVLLVDGDERAFVRRDVRRLDVGQQYRSATRGALAYGVPAAAIGAFGGLLLGAYVGGNGDCSTSTGGFACDLDDPLPPRATAVAAGALVGGLAASYGATAGRWRWTRVALPAREVMLDLAPRRAGLAVRF